MPDSETNDYIQSLQSPLQLPPQWADEGLPASKARVMLLAGKSILADPPAQHLQEFAAL